jgi:hypothetical protein
VDAELLQPVNLYMMPMTMGIQATTTQLVYQPVQTTAGETVVPLRVVSLQRDLDRPTREAATGSVLTALVPLPIAERMRSQPDQPKTPQPGDDAGDEADAVVQHTTRVLTPEQAAQEWDRMTDPAAQGVLLPPNLED